MASAGDCCLCYCDGSFVNASVSVLTSTVAKQGTQSKLKLRALCRLINFAVMMIDNVIIQCHKTHVRIQTSRLLCQDLFGQYLTSRVKNMKRPRTISNEYNNTCLPETKLTTRMLLH